MCLRKREYFAKRGRLIPSEGFRGRLINWQTVNYRQINYGQESRYKRYSIQLPLPFFICLFSVSCTSLFQFFPILLLSPPPHHEFLLTHDSLLLFHFQLFPPVRDSLISHLVFFYLVLSLYFLRVFFLFFLPLPLRRFFFLSVSPSPPIYFLLVLRTAAPFPPVSPFSFATLLFFFQRYERSRIQNAFSGGRSGGKRNYMYAPGLPASASPVRKTWKQVRYTQLPQPANAALADCAARFHVAPAYRSHAIGRARYNTRGFL